MATAQLARQNITDATNGGGCDLDIQQANMLEYAAAADAQPAYDMALTSFAAHHLRTEEKEVPSRAHLALVTYIAASAPRLMTVTARHCALLA